MEEKKECEVDWIKSIEIENWQAKAERIQCDAKKRSTIGEELHENCRTMAALIGQLQRWIEAIFDFKAEMMVVIIGRDSAAMRNRAHKSSE